MTLAATIKPWIETQWYWAESSQLIAISHDLCQPITISHDYWANHHFTSSQSAHHHLIWSQLINISCDLSQHITMSHGLSQLITMSHDLSQLITISCFQSLPFSTVTTSNVHISLTAFDFYFKYRYPSDCNNGTEGTTHASGSKGVKKNCNITTNKEIRGFNAAPASLPLRWSRWCQTTRTEVYYTVLFAGQSAWTFTFLNTESPRTKSNWVLF
jgi:hypothetical protein